MSIAEKLNTINNIKRDIKAALEYKGLTVTNQFDTYAEQIKTLGNSGENVDPFATIGYNRKEQMPWLNIQIAESQDVINKWNPESTTLKGTNIMFYPLIDTSKVTNMNKAFASCSNLRSVATLDTGKVTDMSYAFQSCTQLITIPELNTPKVATMSYMFDGCKLLEYIPTLKANNLTNTSYMFQECTSLKQFPLFENMGKLTNMAYMFSGCTNLENAYMNSYDTSSVTNMSYMFSGCTSLEELNFSGCDLSKVTTWTNITNNCNALTKTIFNSTKIGNGFRFSYFKGLKTYENLDTSALTHTQYLFTDANSNNVDISKFNLSNVTDMSYTFSGNTSSSIILGNVNTSKVTNMAYMFNGCSKITELDLSGLDVSKVTNMDSIFYNCTSLKSINTTGWNTESLTNLSSAFYYVPSDVNISHWNTSKVTNISYMFGYFKGSNIVLDNLDLSNVTSYSNIWSNMSTSITLSLNNTKLFNGFKVAPKATSVNLNNTTGYLDNLFGNCSSLISVDLSKFNMLGTNMNSTFSGCSKLTSIDISVLNTSSITNMQSCFNNCTSLKEVTIGNTSNVTTMESMFYNCYNLVSIKGDLLGTTNKWAMLCNCYKLVDTGKIDLTGITSTYSYYLWGTSNTSYMPSKLRKATFINIGDASTVYGLYFPYWGVEDIENYPTSVGARQSLIDSLITYSKTRETTCTIYLSKNTLAVLTEDEINQINAKGYTLVQK